MAPRLPTKGSNAAILDGSAQGVLDLDMAAQSSESPHGQPILDLDRIPAPDQPRASLKQETSSNKSINPAAAFVVAEVIRGASLAFNGKRSGERFGMILPSDSSIEAKSFFRPGNIYAYGAPAAGQHEVIVRGTFSSPAEAESRYPEVSGSWHTLPAEEIKSLGRSPWLRK